MHSVSAGSPADLVDFRSVQASKFLAVEFFCLRKNNPSNRQRYAHTDGVGRDNDVGFSGKILPHLIPACLGRKGAVDYACAKTVPFQMRRGGKHALSTEADDRVVLLQILIAMDRTGKSQWTEPLVLLHRVWRVKCANEPLQIGQSFRRHADMHDLRVDQTDGLQPCRPALRIGDELRLIDDGCFEPARIVAELNGTADVIRTGYQNGFFAGNHGAGHTRVIELIKHLQSEQTKRREITPGRVLLQILQRAVGFAAVCRSDVKDKRAIQCSRPLNERVRRIGGKQRFCLAALALGCLIISRLLNCFCDIRPAHQLLNLLVCPYGKAEPSSAARAN